MRVEAAIVVEQLVKHYGPVRAVDGVSFSVQRGTVFGLLGRNGAGKTTTLECCIGLVKPTSGTIRVVGLDPTSKADFRALRHRIGVQLQLTSLPEKATARELLTLYAAYYGRRLDPVTMATRVGLEEKLDRLIDVLSGGEKQRLALALALLHDPDVIFLDEPTAGMDAFGRRVLWGEVDRLRESGKAIVLTTHYIEEAERLCDEICVVQQGKIVAQDTPAALVSRYGGAACVTFRARGFQPNPALANAGRWAHDGDRWTVATGGEPGHVLADIVTHANAGGVTIEELDLHRPGLEDAFLAITGEHIDESANQEAIA